MTDLPADVRDLVALVAAGLADTRPDAERTHEILLTLAAAVYAAGQAKGIDFSLARAEALS